MRVRALIAAAALLATLPAPAAAVDTYELEAAALDVVDDCGGLLFDATQLNQLLDPHDLPALDDPLKALELLDVPELPGLEVPDLTLDRCVDSINALPEGAVNASSEQVRGALALAEDIQAIATLNDGLAAADAIVDVLLGSISTPEVTLPDLDVLDVVQQTPGLMPTLPMLTQPQDVVPFQASPEWMLWDSMSASYDGYAGVLPGVWDYSAWVEREATAHTWRAGPAAARRAVGITQEHSRVSTSGTVGVTRNMVHAEPARDGMFVRDFAPRGRERHDSATTVNAGVNLGPLQLGGSHNVAAGYTDGYGVGNVRVSRWESELPTTNTNIGQSVIFEYVPATGWQAHLGFRYWWR